MKRPYCRIDGVVYQLHYAEDGVIRFPNDGRDMPDINTWQLEYFKGKRPLSDLFEYDINSGSSYWFVYGRYHRFGINSHMTSQGPEAFKKFILYR